MSRTSISVSTKTRDRLNVLANQREATVEETINFLIDELWKIRCIDQADKLREDDFPAWSQDIASVRFMDFQLTPDEAVA